MQGQNRSHANSALEIERQIRWHGDKEGRRLGGRWWDVNHMEKKCIRLWSGRPANWNSIGGIHGRSGSHSSSSYSILTHRWAAAPDHPTPLLSLHMAISHLPPLLPPTCCPSGAHGGPYFCPGFRGIPPILIPDQDSSGRHGISSRLSLQTWKRLQIYFQGAAWPVFDRALCNSNKRSSQGGGRVERCYGREASARLIKALRRRQTVKRCLEWIWILILWILLSTPFGPFSSFKKDQHPFTWHEYCISW